MKQNNCFAPQGSKVSGLSKAAEGLTSLNNNYNTSTTTMKYQFTPSDNFKAQIAKKFRELNNVRVTEESSLPADDKTIYEAVTNPIDQLINRKSDIEEDFLIELYDSDVIPGDTAYYTGDNYVDMEANEFLASTAVMIMAYTPTREILAKQALKSKNATMYVTHVSRLVSLMFGGTMTSVDTDGPNHIVNVARRIFFMLDNKLG